MTTQNITMIGAGKMASILGQYFSKAGHKVHIGARESENATILAKKIGHNVQGGSIDEAVQQGDIIFLAVPYLEIPETLQLTGSLDGKIVVDISNPFKSDFTGLLIGGDTSAAEELAKKIPNAKVVKAFNSLFATVLERGAEFGEHRAQVFYAGDDIAAKEIVAKLIETTGFEPIDTGPLFSARFLEPLSALVIQTDNNLKNPVQITPYMLSRSQIN